MELLLTLLLSHAHQPAVDASVWVRDIFNHEAAAQAGVRVGGSALFQYAQGTVTLRNSPSSPFGLTAALGAARFDEPLAAHQWNYCASLLAGYDHGNWVLIAELRHCSNGEGFHQRGDENPGHDQLLVGAGYRF